MRRISKALFVGGLLVAATLVPGPIQAENRPTAGEVELEELASRLTSDRMIERLGAVKTLAALNMRSAEGDRARELLLTARNDPSFDVAVQAEAALAQLDGLALLPSELLADHRNASAQGELDETRSDLDSPRAGARLAAVKRLSGLLSTAEGASAAEIKELLAAARGDSDPAVAAQATHALTRSGGTDPMPPEFRREHRLRAERDEIDGCATALGSATPIQRLEAVQRLAALAATALEPERVVSLLAAAQGDPDWNVAQQAQTALQFLTTRAEAAW